jgi:predicted dehydrogenase
MSAHPLSRIRIGIVGFGYTGRRHLEGYRRIPDVDVVGAVARSAETCRLARDEHDLTCHREIVDLIDRDRPDAVSICSPTPLHRQHAELCIENGLHLLVEKPLGDDIKSGRAIVERAAQAGLTLMVAHTGLYFGSVLRLLALHETGRFGPMRHICLRKEGADVSPRDLEKGVVEPQSGLLSARERIYDDLIHMICLLDKVVGGRSPAEVSTTVMEGPRYQERLDSLVVYDDELTAEVVIKAALDRPLHRSLRIDYANGSLVWRFEDGQEHLEAVMRGEQRAIPFNRNNEFDNTVSSFVDFLRRGIDPFSDGDHGVRVMELSRAIVS